MTNPIYPEWFEEWTTGNYREKKTPEQMTSMLEWLAGLPPNVREILRRFPPSCVVKGKIPLAIPEPGSVGVVVSYGHDAVLVQTNPLGRNPIGECACEWLEVVAFHQGLDYEQTDLLIAEALRLHQKDN